MKTWIILSAAITTGVASCKKYQDELLGPLSPQQVYSSQGRLDTIPYNPTPYTFTSINGLPAMEVPADNPMTLEGVKLGRYLFYEKLLSIDTTVSCASCHNPDKAFTDGRAKALGVNNLEGTRSSMSLINIGYFWNQNRQNNFMWDGKFPTLEAQVLGPVENPVEMANTWENVEGRLREHPHYPRMFRQAFGIENTSQIDRYWVAKAIAQFERTFNAANSAYDKSEWVPFSYLSEEELRGFQLFIGDTDGTNDTNDAECAHCHSFTRNRALFARGEYSNNGLDSAATLNDFVDKGRGGISGKVIDNGRFREVTLRNIALTAPYMHDGRFATLEEVMDHYTGIHNYSSPNIANEITTSATLSTLTAQEKSDIIAFLHALTDTSYLHKPEWSDPFLQSNPWE